MVLLLPLFKVDLHVDIELNDLESMMSTSPMFPVSDTKRFSLPGCRVDLVARHLVKNGEIVRLTATEAELLQYFMDNAGRIVPMEELLVEVWGYSPLSRTKTVYVNICFLRNKLEEDPRNPVVIRTVRGSGYLFEQSGCAERRAAA